MELDLWVSDSKEVNAPQVKIIDDLVTDILGSLNMELRSCQICISARLIIFCLLYE